MSKAFANNNTILDKLSPCDKERFWSKVKIQPVIPELPEKEQPCWDWTGTKTSNGYGRLIVTNDGKEVKLRAHRVARTLADGVEIPDGKIVQHDCDNKICCYPGHLTIGDHLSNMKDMADKNRAAVNMSLAKLDWDAVDEIRQSDKDNKTLAMEHHVTPKTIGRVRNNKIWKDEIRERANVFKDTDVYEMEVDDNGNVKFVI